MLECQTPPPRPGRHPPGPGRPPPGPGRHHPRQTPQDQADTTPQTRQTPPPRDQADSPLGPGRPPPWDQADPPPQDQADTPLPGPGRPPLPREADASIRSMSGRYASYWNAFLFCFVSFWVEYYQYRKRHRKVEVFAVVGLNFTVVGNRKSVYFWCVEA